MVPVPSVALALRWSERASYFWKQPDEKEPIVCRAHQAQPLSLEAEQGTLWDIVGPETVLPFWKCYLFLSASEVQLLGPFQVAFDL